MEPVDAFRTFLVDHHIGNHMPVVLTVVVTVSAPHQIEHEYYVLWPAGDPLDPRLYNPGCIVDPPEDIEKLFERALSGASVCLRAELGIPTPVCSPHPPEILNNYRDRGGGHARAQLETIASKTNSTKLKWHLRWLVPPAKS